MKVYVLYLIAICMFVAWQTFVGNSHYFETLSEPNAIDVGTVAAALVANEKEVDTVPQRKITFIGVKKLFTWAHAYSGMWWQHKRFVLSTDWETRFDHMPVTASEKVLRFRNRGRLTRDWMDFTVEHMSILWKHFYFKNKDMDDLKVFETIQEVLDRYVANVQPDPVSKDSPAPSTIALLSFYGREKHYDVKLKETGLAATLAGLWKIGVTRALVVGNTVEEGGIVQRAFERLLARMVTNPMELKYIAVTQVPDADKRLMPKIALLGLQQAMNGTMAEEQAVEWLGSKDRGERFNFVYFSEEDLVLHTRPSAMKAIRDEMQKGGALSAHRFQPLPHQRFFPPNATRINRLLPDVGRFSNISTLDINAGDACCDAGIYFAHNKNDTSQPVAFHPCPGRPDIAWWQCGFFLMKKKYKDTESIEKLHQFIPEVLVRIEGGTGFPLVNNHQTVCYPRKIGDCD